MRVRPLRYPVDRYLVESSKMFEMVNITDDEIWNPEPALRPEDEIILRKLHEMLQTTADDLKELSKELLKFHEPGVQIKTEPTTLDEEFNEKVHIEEVVNAKFHGYKIAETKHVPETKQPNDVCAIKPINTQTPKIMNTGAQNMKTIRPIIKKNLEISRTRIIQINDSQDSGKNKKLNNGMVYKAPTVTYNEFCYKHIEPEVKHVPQKLKVQDMPCINIRSELKEQKVLQLDILPDSDYLKEINPGKSNVSVVTIRHDIQRKVSAKLSENVENPQVTNLFSNSNKTARKISKMSTCDSSGSANNISSDAQAKQNTQKRIITSIRNSPKTSIRSRYTKNVTYKNDQGNRSRLNLDEWKNKLNTVYRSSVSKKNKPSTKKQTNFSTPLNNTEYIPYSHLTIGGVRASDLEREISDLPNKNDIPLSPILDKIMSSRENSFHKESSRNRVKDYQNILTTSDENLLQEVLDIEKSVSETLSKNLKTKIIKPPSVSSGSSIEKVNDSYADDFEEEKSDRSEKVCNPLLADDKSSDHNNSIKSNLSEIDGAPSCESDDDKGRDKPGPSTKNKDTTYTKSNLSFKDSVDIFEFIHSVDMQDTATQSNSLNIITPKETQTSPMTIPERVSIQPTIHNDLWPAIDPRREVEKMFEMEKDFIKKIIIDEYGDLIEKNIKKPTSNDSNFNREESSNNVSAAQKNTQTSPARVKSVMTSPKKTKTRTTSPFNLSVPVHQQTSPMVCVTDEDVKIDVTNEVDDISVILSSPRFSLRLPQNSREVFSNLEDHSRASSRKSATKICANDKSSNKTFTKTTESSSSVDADNSSSELSSLGEVRMKRLRRRLPSVSECSSSSVVSKYSCDFQSMGILPLRSEGEVSSELMSKRAHKMRSEGETSLEPL